MIVLASIDKLAQITIGPLLAQLDARDGCPLLDKLGPKFRADALVIATERARSLLVSEFERAQQPNFDDNDPTHKARLETLAESLVPPIVTDLHGVFLSALDRASFLLTAHCFRLSAIRSMLVGYTASDDAKLDDAYRAAQMALNIGALVFQHVRRRCLDHFFCFFWSRRYFLQRFILSLRFRRCSTKHAQSSATFCTPCSSFSCFSLSSCDSPWHGDTGSFEIAHIDVKERQKRTTFWRAIKKNRRRQFGDRAKLEEDASAGCLEAQAALMHLKLLEAEQGSGGVDELGSGDGRVDVEEAAAAEVDDYDEQPGPEELRGLIGTDVLEAGRERRQERGRSETGEPLAKRRRIEQARKKPGREALSTSKPTNGQQMARALMLAVRFCS